jgi:lysophospholipase L1-like esterase
MANAGSLVEGFDANTLKTPGSFLKSSSVNVTNIPTQESGIVLDFTNVTNNPCHVEITGTGKLFYRFGTAKKWVMGNASNDYNNRLFNKKMVGLGDSLLYGQGLTPEQRENSTWFALLASQYGMTAYNYAHSGSSIAYDPTDVDPAMCVTIDTIITEHGNEDIDYFVLEGGANDTSNAIELGELTRANETKTTFYGALNYIISRIKSTWPKCRILLMTNYDRKVRTSPVSGYTDEYYVDAMVNFAHFRGIPVFDNYHDLGVSIRDYYDWSTGTYLDNWFFPIASGQHISVGGYAWIAPIYAKKLESI